MQPANFTFSLLRRWLLRIAIVSTPVAGTLASCGGDDSATPPAGTSATGGASGAGTTGSIGSGMAGNSSTGSAGAATTGAAGSIGVGSGGAGGATGAAGGVGTGGAAGASGGTSAGGGDGGPIDGSGGSDGRCVSGEGGPCGGLVVRPCTCGDGLVCIASPLDVPGVCRRPDGGTGDGGLHVCIGSCDRCARGVCCGASCCGVAEWCDESSGTPTCKCGTQPACTMPNTCQPLGPRTENGCGGICCFDNCPQ
jgi:hypothetical protein